ncbi:MAG: putative sulfate/molybdate transporter [Gemmatimonadota bacterium]|nr:putative sulfate/molybdate transporter [Gemmatimonadota bacterium]
MGIIAAARLDSASVLIVFGAMQIATALRYGIPMPVQPLKAMAVLVIAQGIPGNVLLGAGLAIGATMLLLTASGGVEWLARAVPRSVVRGLQLGLGVQLGLLALRDYATSEGAVGYALAAAAFLLMLVLRGNHRLPPALPVIGLGVAYAAIFRPEAAAMANGWDFALPRLHAPSAGDVVTGFLVLAIPQIPLSLGNSLLATQQITRDLFPERAPGVRRIGFTYSLMNLASPWFGGVPVCHGSGGVAGHHAFGARTGGSLVVYGTLLLTAGLFFGPGFTTLVDVFPLPVLGVILLWEALALLAVVRDSAGSAEEWSVVLLVGLLAAGLPYGYAVGMAVGTALVYARRRWPGLI